MKFQKNSEITKLFVKRSLPDQAENQHLSLHNTETLLALAKSSRLQFRVNDDWKMVSSRGTRGSQKIHRLISRACVPGKRRLLSQGGEAPRPGRRFYLGRAEICDRGCFFTQPRASFSLRDELAVQRMNERREPEASNFSTRPWGIFSSIESGRLSSGAKGSRCSSDETRCRQRCLAITFDVNVSHDQLETR